MPALSARMIIPLGCALGLFALSAAHPAAKACPILAEQTAAALAPEFRIDGIETADSWGDEEQIQSYTGDILLNLSDVSAVIEPIAPNGLRPNAGLGVNDPNGSYRVSVQHGGNQDDYALEHNVAISLYLGIYDADADVANDLLTSYHVIGSVSADVTAIINSTIDSVAGPAHAEPFVESGDARQDAQKNVYNIVAWMHFLVSLEMVPYYMIILSLYLIIQVVRILVKKS